jgi:non-ribosomal peptide synthetase component F
MALWQILQARLGNGADVLLATPVSERDRPEWQDVLGMCLNTLPIRARIDPDDTFRTLSQRTRQAFSQDLQHALLPYEDILQAAELSLGPDSLGLPQVMLVLHGEQEWSEDDILPEQHATPIGRHAKNPLGIHITDRQGHSRITLEYDTERFHPATAEALLQRFLAVATQALQNPDIRLADIDILLPGEQERIRTLSGIDHTRPYPDTTIHERFHHTASLHPQRPAVIRADGTATDYQELRRQARQVASFLRHRGLQREQIVAIHLHRSPELLAALLGILEAGGAFLLLEPSIPLDRLRTMADQARVAAILSDADMPVLPGFTDRTHRLPGILAEDVQDMATPCPTPGPTTSPVSSSPPVPPAPPRAPCSNTATS